MSESTSRSLRIGIHIARWPPTHLGGAELQAARIARELAVRGHQIHVFTRAEPGPTPECAPGVELHPHAVAPIRGVRLIWELVECLAQARRVRTDVNLCYITLNSGLLGYAVQRVYDTPCVIVTCGMDEVLPEPRGVRKRLERYLHQRAHRVWIQSAGLQEIMRGAYEKAGLSRCWPRIASRMRVVGNGVDVPTDNGSSPRPPRRFVFVGRLVEEKSLPTLIEAVRRLSDVEVQLVGDGPLAESLQQLARGTGVTFLGRQEREQIAHLLRHSRGLVLSSRTEGLPNVVLEALSYGRPVISTRVGAVPEVVHDGSNGRIVPHDAPDALAAAMQELLDDSTWDRMAAAARPSVERFAWHHFVPHLEGELIDAVDAYGARKRATR